MKATRAKIEQARKPIRNSISYHSRFPASLLSPSFRDYVGWDPCFGDFIQSFFVFIANACYACSNSWTYILGANHAIVRSVIRSNCFCGKRSGISCNCVAGSAVSSKTALLLRYSSIFRKIDYYVPNVHKCAVRLGVRPPGVCWLGDQCCEHGGNDYNPAHDVFL
jgi:hypothetical protein